MIWRYIHSGDGGRTAKLFALSSSHVAWLCVAANFCIFPYALEGVEQVATYDGQFLQTNVVGHRQPHSTE